MARGRTTRVALLLVAGAVAVALAWAARADGDAEQRPYRFSSIAAGFESPVHVSAPRNEPNRLYVVEQGGTIRVFENGRIREQPFLDVQGQVAAGGERGLLSVAFHPNYARNRLFYVYYTDRAGDIRVVEYRSNGAAAISSSARVLFRVAHRQASNHNGGQLAFGPDGFLYAGTGDGGSAGDPPNNAQNLGSRLGKLLRINATRRGAQPAIVGYGLRNPWRFSFDRATGDLYLGDVGQNAWEEVDYTRRRSPGIENYGWRVYEGRARYRPDQRPAGRGRVVFPIVVLQNPPNCSVVGGFVYRGRNVPAARGRYFYGDYCSPGIRSLRVVRGRATGIRREATGIGSLSSFGEDARGELYAVSLSGRLYKLTR